MSSLSSVFETQLDEVVREYVTARARSQHSDVSDVLNAVQVRDLQTRCVAAIERVAGRGSIYFQRASAVDGTKDHQWNHLAAHIGIAMSLLSDLRKGYLSSVTELIHGEVFADLLEMAKHLLDSGYKDAAAVIAGSTLESHVRQLCAKHGVSTDTAGKPKAADALNADLVKAGAYSKLDQKNVTAWLGLRNYAAHGDYSAYDKNQVALLVDAVRDFITRHPA